MKFPALARLESNVHRVAEILGVLAKYGLADWVKAPHYGWLRKHLRSGDGQALSGLGLPQRARMACAELGVTFIKLGQVLATRPDLVGLEVAAELAQLQTAAPAEPAATVRATLAAELGAPVEERFAAFADTPLASASIAQVHCARLPTGEEVVVKIQHSGLERQILPDLDILAALAALAERYSPELRRYQPVTVVRQFRRTLLRELDFTIERRHLMEFAGRFAGDPNVHFPVPYAEWSSRRVLTMERLDGILGTNTAALAASGVDLDEFARRGATMYLQMVFRDAFYHADPHPGNLMLLPGGVVGVLDCGMVGRLDPELASAIDDLLVALVTQDATDLGDTLLRLGSAPPGVSRDQLRADLAEFVADHVGRSLRELDIGAAFGNLLEIVRRYQLTLPPACILLLRTLVELEGTARRLSPEFSLAEVFGPFYTTLLRRRLSPRRAVVRLRRAGRDWERLAGSLPRDLGDVLRRVREGSFHVHLDHHHLDPVVNRLVLGLVTAALLVASALLWCLAAPPVWHGVSLVGAAGLAAAIYLTARLLWAIRKSGGPSRSDE